MSELIVGKGITVFTVDEGRGGYDVHDGATCKRNIEVLGGEENGRGVADYVQTTITKAAAFWIATSPHMYSALDGTSLFLIYGMPTSCVSCKTRLRSTNSVAVPF